MWFIIYIETIIDRILNIEYMRCCIYFIKSICKPITAMYYI